MFPALCGCLCVEMPADQTDWRQHEICRDCITLGHPTVPQKTVPQKTVDFPGMPSVAVIPDRTSRPTAERRNMTNDDDTQQEWYAWSRTSNTEFDDTADGTAHEPDTVDYTITAGGKLRDSVDLRPFTFAVCPQGHDNLVSPTDIGHGPAAAPLTNRVAQAIRLWESTYRQRNARFEVR